MPLSKQGCSSYGMYCVDERSFKAKKPNPASIPVTAVMAMTGITAKLKLNVMTKATTATDKPNKMDLHALGCLITKSKIDRVVELFFFLFFIV